MAGSFFHLDSIPAIFPTSNISTCISLLSNAIHILHLTDAFHGIAKCSETILNILRQVFKPVIVYLYQNSHNLHNQLLDFFEEDMPAIILSIIPFISTSVPLIWFIPSSRFRIFSSVSFCLA